MEHELHLTSTMACKSATIPAMRWGLTRTVEHLLINPSPRFRSAKMFAGSSACTYSYSLRYSVLPMTPRTPSSSSAVSQSLCGMPIRGGMRQRGQTGRRVSQNCCTCASKDTALRTASNPVVAEVKSHTFRSCRPVLRSDVATLHVLTRG